MKEKIIELLDNDEVEFALDLVRVPRLWFFQILSDETTIEWLLMFS